MLGRGVLVITSYSTGLKVHGPLKKMGSPADVSNGMGIQSFGRLLAKRCVPVVVHRQEVISEALGTSVINDAFVIAKDGTADGIFDQSGAL
ncbi:hypothetical protein OOU_Y34scaffold01167g2 [Pyricularia oryzae Y34]|uniref:Uncharacterized protein n=1 Tax=Pyricularia oryzae (strain Y34) TaxID=1143189 RepID=A0AA97NLL7_PYRO3|nr:hypothetical protein OOU_Y34scaffold01167g2 [Pyricularia oryzae Y34]